MVRKGPIFAKLLGPFSGVGIAFVISFFIHMTLDKEMARIERLERISQNKWDTEGKISQKLWGNSPELRLGKFDEAKLLEIVSKIEKGVPIGDISDIEISRGSEGGKALIVDKKKTADLRPIVISDDIDQYALRFTNKYFPIRASDTGKYEKEKILIIRIRNTRLRNRIVATYDTSGLYNLKTLQILNLKEGSKYNLKFLLAILNSG